MTRRERGLFPGTVDLVILRTLAEGPKHGFAIPKGLWLRTHLAPILEANLAPGRLREQGIFDPDYVQGLIKQHNERKRDCGKELWTLLVFQLWYDQYGS